MPSGSLGAQPEIWLNVALIDPDGETVWESGYVDSHGDMADLHSFDVRAGTLPHDDQLFNLQSKFLTTNLKGTDREMYLPVPFDADQIPFIRPANVPTSVLNHPPFIRMEKRSIPPLGSKDAAYTVPGRLLQKPGRYRLAVRLRSRAEPIYFMKFVGATEDMVRAMNEWMVDIHPYTVEVTVEDAAAGGAREAEHAGHGEHDPAVFRADPAYDHTPYDPAAQLAIYGGKHLNPTARPLLELGRPLYREGPLEPAKTWFGKKNPSSPHLMVYGDWRTAAAYNDFGVADASGETYQATVATRLNLEFDLKLTATERLHLFIRPTEEDGRFTRYDLSGRNEGFEEAFDLDLDTFFFEGEVGPIVQGMTGRENEIDLPFALGLFPLFTQNGVWTEDAINGLAFTLPAFSSDALDASNVDLTFFAAFDEVTTEAVTRADGTLADTANLYGVAGFVEANEGYWELGYGFVDAGLDDLDYHNVTLAFSRRYGGRIANSVRLIGNLGQDPAPGREKTADGALLLVESYLLTRRPYTLVPYLNLFAGFERPQALVRAADAGGVLKNTGINFETDGLTGYPRLDDRAHDAWGGALGLQYLFDLDQQVVLELAGVQRLSGGVTEALGDEYALGLRWQRPVTHAWIVRADAMHGWLPDRENLYGVRFELRRKF